MPRGPKGLQQLRETHVRSDGRVGSRRAGPDLLQSGVTLMPTGSHIGAKGDIASTIII